MPPSAAGGGQAGDVHPSQTFFKEGKRYFGLNKAGKDMKRFAKNILGLAFLIDAIIAIGFGLYAWLSPHDTFGTIIAIPATHASAFLSILSSLSLFYMLIGLICVVGIKSPFPFNMWVGLIMLARHFAEGAFKVGDMHEDWLIGNPYPDLIIHSVFVLLYAWAVYAAYKKQAMT